MNEGEMVLGFRLPPDAESPVVVMPAIGALHDPAPRPATNAPDQRSLAASTNVRGNAAASSCDLTVFEVVGFIETDVFGTTWTARCTNRYAIERRADHPFVVDVGASQLDANWYATTIGQYVSLGAELSPISGIGTRESPPFGAFTDALSREDHFQSMPRCSS